jgi:hypothetical protein
MHNLDFRCWSFLMYGSGNSYESQCSVSESVDEELDGEILESQISAREYATLIESADPELTEVSSLLPLCLLAVAY